MPRSHLLSQRAALLACTLATLLAGSAWAQDEEAVSLERRLPTDVVAYLSVPDVSKLKEDWFETALGRLSSEPELAEFIEQLKGPLTQAAQQVEDKVGIGMMDILAVPQGELAFAVIQSAGRPISGVMLLDFGESRDTIDKLMEKAETALTDEGAVRTEEEFEDSTIISLTAPKDEDAPPQAQAANTLAYVIKDSFIVLSTRPESLKAILTRWDGKHERTFAEKPVYAHIKETCRDAEQEGPADLVWFIDPIGLFRGGMASMSDPVATAGMMAFLPTLGVDRLRGMGGTMNLSEGEYDSISRTLIYMEPPTKGVLNMLKFPAVSQTPPAWVKSDATSYSAIHWDVATAFNSGRSLYETFAGEGSLDKMISDLAEAEDGPKIHLQKDVLDQVTGTFHIVGRVAAAGEGEDEEAPDETIVAIELKDEKVFQQTLATLAGSEGFPGEAREFQGETIYEMKSGETVAGVGVLRGHLVIGTPVAALEAFIRNDQDQESLADSAIYQKVAAKFPAETSTLSFQRSDAQIKALYDLARSGEAESLTGESEVDFSKLPDFSVIQPYLAASGSYMVPVEKGLLITTFALRTEKSQE